MGFWYNPTIHPYTEYRSRRDCLRDYAQQVNLTLVEQDEYGLRDSVPVSYTDLDVYKRQA